MSAGPLIGAAELAEALASDGGPTVLDVRWDAVGGPDRKAYEEAHVPGAVFVDLDEQLADPASERGRHPLPSPARFSAAMRAAGVSGDRDVVVYGAGSAMAAARAWWLLRYFGHEGVRFLDGGFASWQAAGFPVESGPGADVANPDDFTARPGGMPVVEADEVDGLAARGVLIDARAAERFRGELEPIDPVAGHIPGARNRPTGENLKGGRFRPAGELREAFAQLGVRQGVAVAAYCGSGVAAAHEVLALELAGYPAALYPGSWSEWITDPKRPIAS